MGKNQWDNESYGDDFEDEEVEEQPKQSKNPLRAQLKKLERENKALKEQVTSQRTNRIGEVLTAKGVSAKYAKHYPADRDVTEESILSYLSEEFDITPDTSGGGQDGDETSDDDLAELRKIHNAQQGGASGGVPSIDQQITELRTTAFKEGWSTEQFVEETNKLFKS